jgi:hypothetical protein
MYLVITKNGHTKCKKKKKTKKKKNIVLIGKCIGVLKPATKVTARYNRKGTLSGIPKTGTFLVQGPKIPRQFR